MTKAEEKKINENKKLWRDIKVLYNAYLKPTKKEQGLNSLPCFPYLYKGRNAN